MFTPLLVSLASLALGAHAIVPDNLVATSLSGALSALKYTGVGGSGQYDQVTNLLPGQFPTCNANPSCIKTPKKVSGKLAPFDEDLTFVFRGPMNIYNIAVYQPDASGQTWNRASSWAANQKPSNMVFMNNMGGGKSGEWSSTCFIVLCGVCFTDDLL